MENAELCLKNKFKVGDRVRLNPEAPEIITYLRRNKRNIVSGINSLMIRTVLELLDSCEQVVWIDPPLNGQQLCLFLLRTLKREKPFY